MNGILTIFDQIANKMDLPDYEYEEIAENQEEEKQNGGGNRYDSFSSWLMSSDFQI